MNVQPKPTPDCTAFAAAPSMPHGIRERRPTGPRVVLTWPSELEVDPWRP
jgi:hypothetical protein